SIGHTFIACRFCKTQEKSRTDMDAHMRQSHPDKYAKYRSLRCIHCDFRGETTNDLYTHIKANHVNEKKLYSCEYCSFKTTSAEKSDKHSKMVKCKECVYIAPACDMKSHIHTKKLYCPNPRCIRKGFLADEKFRDHISGGENESCTICMKRRPLCVSKDEHCRREHSDMWLSHSTECHHPFCDYRSIDSTHLKTHENTHAQHDKLLSRHHFERNTLCPYCSLQVANLGELNSHFSQEHSFMLTIEAQIFRCVICCFTAARVHEIIDHWIKMHGRCSFGISIRYSIAEKAHLAYLNAQRKTKRGPELVKIPGPEI
ncbi:hypothetical protein PENTCL1PPCAC_5730, partial [Pristionchus entomophagus]